MSDINSKCDTFSNTSLIVIFLVIIASAGIIYYFYRKNTLSTKNEDNKFKNDLLNDPRKKLISELFNNNISILLDIIKNQICPSLIKPEFDSMKSEISDNINKFNTSSKKNKEIIIIQDSLNKMTSNILLYIVVLNQLNKKNIPSTFYVEDSPPENEGPTDMNPPENEEPTDFNNRGYGYMSLIKIGRNGRIIINGEETDMNLEKIVNNNKDLINQITSIMSYYINKIFPGTTFNIDDGWKLQSNVIMNKENILKIMEHYYNMLCGNQDKLKLYSNTLTNLLIDFTDVNLS